MSRTPTTLNDLTSEHALVSEAARGLELAFDELYRRHAPAAWRLAHALTGETERAERAVAEAMATVFTAVRAGRVTQDRAFATVLLTATRNAALDQGAAPAPASPLAARFAATPEHWRTATWLRLAEGAETTQVAAVLGLGDDDASALTSRATQGLATGAMHEADLATGPTCDRAIGRLAADAAGDLPADQREHLDRHLRLCDPCTARHTIAAGLPASLRALAPALPGSVRDRARTAWTGAVAPAAASTGVLSPLTEKVIAGVSAFAAAVGVLSFALLGAPDAGEDSADLAAAAPVTPLLDLIPAPRAFDLSEAIAIPVSRAIPAQESEASGDARAADAPTEPVAAEAKQDLLLAAPALPTADEALDDTPNPASEGDDPAPSLTVGTEVGGTPIAVEVGTDPGLTVGDVSVGSEPQPADEPVVVDDGSGDSDTADASESTTTEVVETTDATVDTSTETVTDAGDSLGL